MMALFIAQVKLTRGSKDRKLDRITASHSAYPRSLLPEMAKSAHKDNIVYTIRLT